MFQSQPPETDEHPRHVVARVRHAIGVPVDRHRAAVNQEDLTAGIHAMASAHVDVTEPKCGGVQAVEHPPRLVAKRPAEIGEAPPAPLQKTQLILQAHDPPRLGAASVKSREPTRASLGREHAIGSQRIQNRHRRANAGRLLVQQQAQWRQKRDRSRDRELFLRAKSGSHDFLHRPINI